METPESRKSGLSILDSDRPILSEKYLEEKYSYDKFRSENVFKNTKQYIIKYYKPSKSCLSGYFFKRFPFFEWITKYDLKNEFVPDLIGGITVNFFLNIDCIK